MRGETWAARCSRKRVARWRAASDVGRLATRRRATRSISVTSASSVLAGWVPEGDPVGSEMVRRSLCGRRSQVRPAAARSVPQPPRRTCDAAPGPAIDPESGRSTVPSGVPRAVVLRAVHARVGWRRRAGGRSRGTRGCRRPGSATLGTGDGAEGQQRDEQEPECTIPHGRRYVPRVLDGLDVAAWSHDRCDGGNSGMVRGGRGRCVVSTGAAPSFDGTMHR